MGVDRAGPVRIRRFGPAVEGVVLIHRRLKLAVSEYRQIAIRIVDVAFTFQQRIGSGAEPVHVVEGVTCQSSRRLGVGDTGQVTIRIVAELREPGERIGDARHAVQVIVTIARG
jgi:hypothetical protein